MISRILCFALINIAHVQPKPFEEIEPLQRVQRFNSLRFNDKQNRLPNRAEDYGDMDSVTELHVDYDEGAVYHKKIVKNANGSQQIVIQINEGGENVQPVVKNIDKPVTNTTTEKSAGKKGGVSGFFKGLWHKGKKAVAYTAKTIGKGIKYVGKTIAKPFKSNDTKQMTH